MGEMIKKRKTRKTIRPIYEMVLIRHDKDQDKTEGGILLPDTAKIKTSTGVVAAMTERMKDNEHDYPFKEGDRVMYDLRERIPYNSDPNDQHYLVKAEFILGVIEEEEIEDDEEEQEVSGHAER